MSSVNSGVTKSVLEAFTLTWDMYRDAIEEIPEEHWRTGDIAYLTPARLVHHALEAVEFYTGDSEEFKWGNRLGVDWETATPEQLPTKQQATAYLDEMIERTGSWLMAQTDEEITSRQEVFRWTGGTLLSRALYVMMHCRQHLGEINAELRRRGLKRVKWRTF